VDPVDPDPEHYLHFPIKNGSKLLSSSLLATLHALIFSSGKVTSSHWAVFFEMTELEAWRHKT
jgi:hypothetical protein